VPTVLPFFVKVTVLALKSARTPMTSIAQQEPKEERFVSRNNCSEEQERARRLTSGRIPIPKRCPLPRPNEQIPIIPMVPNAPCLPPGQLLEIRPLLTEPDSDIAALSRIDDGDLEVEEPERAGDWD
jgi:hypothetical protein